MERILSIPRLLIGGTGSGVGKTTTMVGLTRALQKRGLRVITFKCGPDYLDPTYHKRASGHSCHNLDGWMMGKEGVLSTFFHASQFFDLALIEGVMGLFDGVSPSSEEGSSAEIAKWLSAPTLLVVDVSGMVRTVAAIAQGFKDFDADLPLAGIVCNQLGSQSHLELIAKSPIKEVPILGGWPKEEAFHFPERHLGLLTAEGISDAHLSHWGNLAEDWFDLKKIVSLAKGAPPLSLPSCVPHTDIPPCCRIGIAVDEAFFFYYEYNLRRLESLGARLVRFSPLNDLKLPNVDGLILGGGYPEVYAKKLSDNSKMQEEIRRFKGPIYAECGGLMYLSKAIQTFDGKCFPMVGFIPGIAVMRDQLQALAYVEVETQMPSLLGPAGLRFRGHQFRYSSLEGLEEAVPRYYEVQSSGGESEREGFGCENVLASYVHVHWASNPRVPQGIIESCLRYQDNQKSRS